MTPAVLTLHGEADRPVWSLIATALGDRVRHDEAPLTGPELVALLGRLGIKPQAVRTALHRLRADNWVMTTKTGRTSLHRLTDRALDETRRAFETVYGLEGPAMPPLWSLLTEAPGDAFVRIDANLWLRAGSLGDEAGLEGTKLRLNAVQMERLWPTRLRDDARSLGRRLAMAMDTKWGAEDGPALRLLIIHDWRRIALKAPPLPDGLAPPDWTGAALRGLVAEALTVWPSQASARDRS